jgi:hypothetical protein
VLRHLRYLEITSNFSSNLLLEHLSSDLIEIVSSFQGGATQMRFQPRKGKYLAAASEKAIYILDGETQHPCRNPLQVGHRGSPIAC